MEENSNSLDGNINEASLEGNNTEDTSSDNGADLDNATEPPKPENDKSEKPKNKDGLISKIFKFKDKLNIFVLLILFIVVVVSVILIVTFLQSKSNNTLHFKSKGLSQSALQQLASSDTSVGNSQSILHVEASSIFDSQVFFKQSVGVAGNLQVGGGTNSTTLNISGISQLSQTEVNKNLDVAGTVNIQGSTTIGSSLQVNGSGSFSGNLSTPQLTTTSLTLNGDLVLTHHITSSGSIPGKTSGSALGGGGTVSMNGNDISGSISINTGSSPPAGCFITITFSRAYPSTPHILVTPIGSAAGGISYYLNKSNTNFSVCSASVPPASSSFGYDYFVID